MITEQYPFLSKIPSMPVRIASQALWLDYKTLSKTKIKENKTKIICPWAVRISRVRTHDLKCKFDWIFCHYWYLLLCMQVIFQFQMEISLEVAYAKVDHSLTYWLKGSVGLWAELESEAQRPHSCYPCVLLLSLALLVLCWLYLWISFIHGTVTLLLPFSGPQCPWNSRSPKEVRGLAGHPVLGLERHGGCREEGMLSEKL